MTAAHLARSQQAADTARRRITILGATGSIGASTVDLIKRAPERYGVVAVTARRSADALAQIARSVGAQMAVVADPAAYGELKQALSGSGMMPISNCCNWATSSCSDQSTKSIHDNDCETAPEPAPIIRTRARPSRTKCSRIGSSGRTYGQVDGDPIQPITGGVHDACARGQ